MEASPGKAQSDELATGISKRCMRDEQLNFSREKEIINRYEGPETQKHSTGNETLLQAGDDAVQEVSLLSMQVALFAAEYANI